MSSESGQRLTQLSLEELERAQGGLNPQPLPPGAYAILVRESLKETALEIVRSIASLIP